MGKEIYQPTQEEFNKAKSSMSDDQIEASDKRESEELRDFFYSTYPSETVFDKPGFELASRINKYFSNLNDGEIKELQFWAKNNAFRGTRYFDGMSHLSGKIHRPLVQIISAVHGISENDSRFLLAKNLMSNASNFKSVDPKYYGLDECVEQGFIKKCLQYGVDNASKLINYEAFISLLSEIGSEIGINTESISDNLPIIV